MTTTNSNSLGEGIDKLHQQPGEQDMERSSLLTYSFFQQEVGEGARRLARGSGQAGLVCIPSSLVNCLVKGVFEN